MLVFLTKLLFSKCNYSIPAFDSHFSPSKHNRFYIRWDNIQIKQMQTGLGMDDFGRASLGEKIQIKQMQYGGLEMEKMNDSIQESFLSAAVRVWRKRAKQRKSGELRHFGLLTYTGARIYVSYLLMTDSGPLHKLFNCSSFSPPYSPPLHPDLHLHTRQDPSTREPLPSDIRE